MRFVASVSPYPRRSLPPQVSPPLPYRLQDKRTLTSALAAAAGAAALGCLVGLTMSPIAARAVEVVEYLALAAVLPLACWVGGIYGLARGLSLT